MNEIEKIDYTLKILYNSTKDGGMIKIIQAFKDNEHSLTIEELKDIKSLIELKGFAVFQIEPRGVDYRGQITDNGKNFVLINSFSEPGKSILDL